MSRLLIVIVLFLVSACDVDVGVGIDVAQDGSGTVAVEARFDEAAENLIGDLSQQLRLDDVARAGWDVTIESGQDGDGGGTVVLATKPVASADGWQAVLDEIVGPGVFTDVEVVGDAGRQRLSFDLDLSDGWSLFADDEVTAVLDGEPFGAPIETLAQGRSIDEIITIDLGVSVRNLEDEIPATASYSPRFDDARPLRVNVEAAQENSTAVLIRWISMALFSLFALATVLAITGVVLQRRSDRLRPAPTPASLASRVPGQPTSVAPANTANTAASSPDPVRLVVIEPLAVLYDHSRSLDEHVLLFVRDRDGSARADTIAAGHQSLVLGSMETAGFWELCGVEGAADTLDEAFTAQRQLRPGARAFFDEMQRRRIPVAATTNDAAVWSNLTRDRDRLSVVWPWLVSADVGALTSNSGMFEVLRRESSIAHSHCLYVDNNLGSLDAAKELGMKTAFFDTGEVELPPVVGHPVVRDLKALFGSKR